MGDKNCWIELFDDTRYDADDPHIKVEGPKEYASLKNLSGRDWNNDIQSVNMGSTRRCLLIRIRILMVRGSRSLRASTFLTFPTWTCSLTLNRSRLPAGSSHVSENPRDDYGRCSSSRSLLVILAGMVAGFRASTGVAKARIHRKERRAWRMTEGVHWEREIGVCDRRVGGGPGGAVAAPQSGRESREQLRVCAARRRG